MARARQSAGIGMIGRCRVVATAIAAIVFSGAGASLAPAEEKPADIPADYRLQYSQDFAAPQAVSDFVFSDPAAWRISPSGDKPALELVKQSNYKPPFRSPVNIALVGDKQFGDFVLDVECMQTGKEYGHRDMVLFFGYQDPANYYYVHIATKADDHANQIFIVDDAPRRKISQESNSGNNWGLNVWRHVRLERRLASGQIKVNFEDMTRPIMVAEDKTFGAGWLGFGSFDDTGKVTAVRVWGPSDAASPQSQLRRPEFPRP